MFIGPVFTREATILPRRPRLYVLRTVYPISLLVLMCTAWMVLAGTQVIRNIGDMAKFGELLFQILAMLQLALVLFLASLQSASAVAQEKDRMTLILLLMTRMSNSELVLGKLTSSLLTVLVMLATGLPIFALITLFGGVSMTQVFAVFAVTCTTALLAGSLGSILAFWREKTFQALAATALAIVFWIGIWEVVGALEMERMGVSTAAIANACSPLRAIFVATGSSFLGGWSAGIGPYLIVTVGLSVLLNSISIWRVRIWNPSRESRPVQAGKAEQESIWGVDHDIAKSSIAKSSIEKSSIEKSSIEKSPTAKLSTEKAANKPDEQSSALHKDAADAEQIRSGHVDARVRKVFKEGRRVGDNPILWRETKTWAYGKKIIVVRLAYWILFCFAAIALYVSIENGSAVGLHDEIGTDVPVAAKSMAPFFLVSLVLVNALAVTSITNERDGRSLDLLLVTDISPKEFLLGKLLGVLYVTRDMVLMPMALAPDQCII